MDVRNAATSIKVQLEFKVKKNWSEQQHKEGYGK